MFNILRRKKRYRYFVSFSFTKDGIMWTPNNCEIVCKNQIGQYDHIMQIEQRILEEYKEKSYVNVRVFNWQLLTTSTVPLED